MTVIKLTLEVRHYYYVHCTPGTCNTGRLPGKSLLSPPAPEEKKTLLTARPSDSADPERGWARGDFRIWTRFLRKYVYFRDIRLDLTPVPLQIWKSWAGLGTKLQPVANKYVEVYETS